MRRFFTEPANIKNMKTAYIFEDARHIKNVLRMNTGDEVIIFDGSGNEYLSRLCEINQDCCLAEIIKTFPSENEPSIKLTLYQAIPKSDKFETVIQKGVELGISEFVPVLTKRCVSLIKDDKKGSQKILRLNKISKEASKQCGRGILPKVLSPIDIKTLAEKLSNHQLSIILYEEYGHNGKKNLKRILKDNKDKKDIAVFVGPEGGISTDEIDFLLKKVKDIKTVGLGKRILRTETAGIAAASIIMYEFDEM